MILLGLLLVGRPFLFVEDVQKAPNDKRRISSLACFSTAHVYNAYVPLLGRLKRRHPVASPALGRPVRRNYAASIFLRRTRRASVDVATRCGALSRPSNLALFEHVLVKRPSNHERKENENVVCTIKERNTACPSRE